MGHALKKTDDQPTPPAFTVLPAATTAAAVATPAATQPAPKKRGLSLGKIGPAAPSTKAAKTYPIAELSDEDKEMVSDLLAYQADVKAKEGSIETWKKRVNELVLPQWIQIATGQLEPPSSMIVPGVGTDSGMLVIAGETGGRYNGTTEAIAVEKLAELVGEDVFPTTFTEKVTLKVELDKVAEDKQQPLVDALLAVFEEHGASHAVTAKTATTFQPLARRARFQLFDAATNLAIHQILPIIPSFKARS